MKRQLYVLFSLVICVFTSCEKSDDHDAGSSAPSYVETADYVDLGLDGLLFATKNLGAKSPEDFGDYFAWGEVSPKSYYDWKTYKWAEPTTEENYIYDRITFSKYFYPDNVHPDYAFLQPEDDAATVILGEGWRMPTFEEMSKLMSCEYRKAIKNGVFYSSLIDFGAWRIPVDPGYSMIITYANFTLEMKRGSVSERYTHVSYELHTDEEIAAAYEMVVTNQQDALNDL